MTLAYERLVPTRRVKLIATPNAEVSYGSYGREIVRHRRDRGTGTS